MGNVLQDVRFALRQIVKAPAFAVTVILTLALGIGANTAIFTLVHAVLLKSLPVANPAQLYRIGDTDNCCVNGGFVSSAGDFDIFSYDLYKHLMAAAPEFESLAAMQSGSNTMNVRRGSGTAKPLVSEYVSGNYFSTFGISPFAGRLMSRLRRRAQRTAGSGSELSVVAGGLLPRSLDYRIDCYHPRRPRDHHRRFATGIFWRPGKQRLTSLLATPVRRTIDRARKFDLAPEVFKLALRCGPRSLRHKYHSVAGKAVRVVAPVSLERAGLYAKRRQYDYSETTCRNEPRRRRHSEHAAANQQRPVLCSWRFLSSF